nr:hypothetical protein [Bacteroidota bacterium]
MVSTLLDGWQSNGDHHFTYGAEGLKGGIYYYKLESQELSEVKKMIVLR